MPLTEAEVAEATQRMKGIYEPVPQEAEAEAGPARGAEGVGLPGVLAAAAVVGDQPAAETVVVAAPPRTTNAVKSAEAHIVRDPVSGAFSLDPDTGRPLWPPQPVPEPLEAPVQVYREVPANAVFYTDAARERAAGWVIPNPRLDEVILMREALRMACRRVALRRDPDDSKVEAALVRCADLVAAGTVEQLVEAIITRALSMWVDQNLGADSSPVSAVSWRLETRWRQLLFDNKRAVIQSLDGRPSPEAGRLRRHVEGMLGLVAPPPLGRNDYVIMPG